MSVERLVTSAHPGPHPAIKPSSPDHSQTVERQESTPLLPGSVELCQVRWLRLKVGRVGLHPAAWGQTHRCSRPGMMLLDHSRPGALPLAVNGTTGRAVGDGGKVSLCLDLGQACVGSKQKPVCIWINGTKKPFGWLWFGSCSGGLKMLVHKDPGCLNCWRSAKLMIKCQDFPLHVQKKQLFWALIWCVRRRAFVCAALHFSLFTQLSNSFVTHPGPRFSQPLASPSPAACCLLFPAFFQNNFQRVESGSDRGGHLLFLEFEAAALLQLKRQSTASAEANTQGGRRTH